MIRLPKFHCLHCEHEWYPRNEEIPRVCPKCKSPRWDKPLKYPKKSSKLREKTATRVKANKN